MPVGVAYCAQQRTEDLNTNNALRGPRPAGALNQQCSDAVSQSGLWAELSLEQKQRLQSKAGMIFSAANFLSNGACPYNHRK
jgi:hypothetical protein